MKNKMEVAEQLYRSNLRVGRPPEQIESIEELSLYIKLDGDKVIFNNDLVVSPRLGLDVNLFQRIDEVNGKFAVYDSAGSSELVYLTPGAISNLPSKVKSFVLDRVELEGVINSMSIKEMINFYDVRKMKDLMFSVGNEKIEKILLNDSELESLKGIPKHVSELHLTDVNIESFRYFPEIINVCSIMGLGNKNGDQIIECLLKIFTVPTNLDIRDGELNDGPDVKLIRPFANSMDIYAAADALIDAGYDAAARV